MNLPENASNIIAALERAGFEAYVVGGCVRDGCLGRAPKDWDICTSALPEQVEAVFEGERVLETGIKHGTVTVMMGEPIEITTFRLDGKYVDSRRPESVTFTTDLEADLARRDFTVNAMAYSPRTGLIDPFGGRGDIEKGLIRAVGDPRERFREDALRILRALRFSVVLGFDIDGETGSAMLERRSLLGRISAERVRDELIKTVRGGKVKPAFMRFREIIAEVLPELRPCFDFEQRTVHHRYDVYEHILTAVDACETDAAAVKLALLLHDAAKPPMFRFKDGSAHFKGHPAVGAEMADRALRRLKLDNKTRITARELIRFHDVRLKGGMPQILKILSVLGEENTALLFPVMRADALAQSEYKREEKLALINAGEENFRLALQKGLCFRVGDLNADGNDAAALGLGGRMIRAALRCALNGVMCGKAENEKEALISYMASMAEKWGGALPPK